MFINPLMGNRIHRGLGGLKERVTRSIKLALRTNSIRSQSDTRSNFTIDVFVLSVG